MRNDNVEKLAFSVEEYRTALGISRTRAYADIREGLVKTFKIGRLTRIPGSEVRRRAEGLVG